MVENYQWALWHHMSSCLATKFAHIYGQLWVTTAFEDTFLYMQQNCFINIDLNRSILLNIFLHTFVWMPASATLGLLKLQSVYLCFAVYLAQWWWYVLHWLMASQNQLG